MDARLESMNHNSVTDLTSSIAHCLLYGGVEGAGSSLPGKDKTRFVCRSPCLAAAAALPSGWSISYHTEDIRDQLSISLKEALQAKRGAVSGTI